MKKTSLSLALALLLLIGFYFRWRYLQEISLYVDEFTTLWAARHILEKGVPVMPSGVLYTRGIFSSYIEAAFLGAFGFTYEIGRLPSLLFGLATIGLIGLIGQREWNWRVGWLAAIGLTLLPEAIVWSGRARFYAQLQFFVLLAVWAGWRSIQNEQNDGASRASSPHNRWQWLFALFFALALYSQEETLLLYPSIVLAALLWRGWRFFTQPVVLAAHALCVLAMGSRYAIEIWGQPGYFETIQQERPYVGLIFDLPGAWSTYQGLLIAPTRLFYTLLGVLALVVALGTLWRLQRRSAAILTLSRFHQATLFFALQFGFVLGVILLFVGQTWRDPRYLFIIQPFWLLLGAAGGVWVVEQLTIKNARLSASLKKRLYMLAYATLSMIAVLSLLPAAQETLSKQEEGYDLGLAFVAEERQPDDVILTPQPPACALVLGQPCNYYAVQRRYEEYVIAPSRQNEQASQDKRLIDRWSGAPLLNSATELEAVIRASPRTWFVIDGLRLATRYDEAFIRIIIEQFDIVFSERGVIVLRADGWREWPTTVAQEQLEPPVYFGPLALTSWSRGDGLHSSSESLQSLEENNNLTVKLSWQGAERTDKRIKTFAHLIQADGSRVSQDDSSPARGMVPTYLFDEKTLPDFKRLSLPPDLALGRYRIDVGAYEWGSVTPLAEPLAIDWITIGPPPSAPTEALDIAWQNGVQLLGHDQIPDILRPNESFTLRLVWSTNNKLSQPYTFFVHLTGPDHIPIAQSDRPPLGGFYPTTAWDEGEWIEEYYTLTLPPDLPAGRYMLLTGLYRPEDFQRPLTVDGSDAVQLGTIEVVQ